MRGDFAGVCYDGPEEGKWYVWPRPWFFVAIKPPIYFSAYLNEGTPLHIEKLTYVWSYSMRKWCIKE